MRRFFPFPTARHGCAGWVFAVGLLAAFAAASARAAGEDDYGIAAGDILTFDFLDDAEPAQTIAVTSDGRAAIPLIGAFPVAGLSVSAAMERMRQAFVDRHLFIDPQIALSITSFRPIFVLGDVKAPGSFPFQASLTVEQAVALAGGQSTGGATAEDRVVSRARLRGDLDETAVQLTREAVTSARLSAQLAGHSTVTSADIPEALRGAVDETIAAGLLPTEQRLLDVETRGFETRRSQIAAAIQEVNGALSNLAELAEKQKATIEMVRDDLARARDLQRRGIKTLTDISNVERDVSSQESHLLEIFNEMSTARRELGELQRQLADATDTRQRTALSTLQDHNSEIQRLLAARRSLEEQIMLISSLAAEEARKVNTIVFDYQIRRTEDGRTQTRPASLDDRVAPGDTILVSIDRIGGAPGGLPLAGTGVGLALTEAR